MFMRGNRCNMSIFQTKLQTCQLSIALKYSLSKFNPGRNKVSKSTTGILHEGAGYICGLVDELVKDDSVAFARF